MQYSLRVFFSRFSPVHVGLATVSRLTPQLMWLHLGSELRNECG
jgi:hypothetical protein